jgi:hypothetical protein
MKNVWKGLLIVAAMLMSRSTYAQSCYQYSGPMFATQLVGAYTASDHVTATLILTSPITSAISYSNSSPFLAPSFLTMSDGVQTLDTATSSQWVVSFNPQVPLWYAAVGDLNDEFGPHIKSRYNAGAASTFSDGGVLDANDYGNVVDATFSSTDIFTQWVPTESRIL